VLAGLGHAHEHGVVHRDVKPSNVFLPRRRPAKVMDFGVARVAGGTTAAGVVVGTPNYMSPEQVRTGLVDGRSDLFSVGLILFELATGEKAYRADNVVSLLYKIAHEEPPLVALPAGPQWERPRKVVARALAREPEDRYPDAPATPAPAPPSVSTTLPAAASPAPVSASVRPPPAGEPNEAVAPPSRPGDDAARLERANDLFDRGRFAAALAEARAVLARNPGNAEARTLVEDAEAAVVAEDRIKKARDALRKG